jgi:hypothetical protein
MTIFRKTMYGYGGGTPRGSSAIYSLLHSPDGSVFYINRAQEGGVSNSKQAQDQIQQHSQALGESAQLMKMPRKNGVPDGLIAVWGKVRLEQLDQDSIKTLLDRKGLKKGLLIDFLGNFSRSAKAGLPIYRIDGGPGLVWATNFGQKGRGIVRLAAVDLTRLVAPPVEQQPVAQSSGNSSEVSETPQPELSIVTEKVQSRRDRRRCDDRSVCIAALRRVEKPTASPQRSPVTEIPAQLSAR